jgi:hypothetical protein
MRLILFIFLALCLQACKHPLEIRGGGDIAERLNGVRGCTLEEFQLAAPRCTNNEATEQDYIVSYEAIPRPGWVFIGWEGTACSTITEEGFCEYNLEQAWVDFIDITWSEFSFPSTIAIFEPELASVPFAVDYALIPHMARPGPSWPEFRLAVTYGDYNQDGYTDIFAAPGKFQSTELSGLEMWLNDGNDNFVLDNSVLVNPDLGGFHPRKAVTADFNGDGKDDIIIADHGYDAEPFPGAAPILLLSSANGMVRASGLDDIVGFHHAVAVGDIDYDGDVDALFTDFFLINDGSGAMTYSTTGIPEEVRDKGYYTTELIDVDKDGFLDMLLGGHEFSNAATVIYWGNLSSQFSALKKTVLPATTGFGIVVDIDVGDFDGDGNNDIALNRAGSPPENSFYGGKYIQILKGNRRSFTDISAASIDNEGLKTYALRPESDFDMSAWIDWLIVHDYNGDGFLDLILDDEGLQHHAQWFDTHFVLINDGQGRFTMTDVD